MQLIFGYTIIISSIFGFVSFAGTTESRLINVDIVNLITVFALVLVINFHDFDFLLLVQS